VKKLFVLVIVMLFLLLNALPGFGQVVLDTGLKVYDYADLFTREEEDALMEKAQRIASEKRMDVVVVTTDDTYGKSSMDYADDFFDYNGFGYGPGYDGVLLLIDIGDRMAWISTHGKGLRVFSDSRIDNILDKMEGHLKNDRFYKAADVFLDRVDYYLLSGFKKSVKHIPVYLVISVVVAGISVGVMASHNKGRKTVTADTYLDRESVRLRDNRDIYIRTSVTKRDISSSSGSSGGRSSTHRSSSGRSHGGGGRSF